VPPFFEKLREQRPWAESAYKAGGDSWCLLIRDGAADNIVSIGKDKLAAMFNGVIRCLAKQGIFPKNIVKAEIASLPATPRSRLRQNRNDDYKLLQLIQPTTENSQNPTAT